MKIKKKIRQNINFITPTQTLTERFIYGELLKELREQSQMLLYSALAETTELVLEKNILTIGLKESKLTDLIQQKEGKEILDKFFKRYNCEYKIKIHKEEVEDIIGKLKELIGNKLTLKEGE